MSPTCDDARTSLSARLDGEDAPLPRAEVDAHVRSCDACSAFAASLPLLAERVAAFRALEVPDRTAEILAASATEQDAARSRATTELRALLALAALVQAVVAVAALAGVGLDHVARDLAVLELATAGGLAAAAWRPSLAAGLLPVVVVAAAAGVLASLGDVLAGTSSVADELSHLVLLVAVWPLAVLARQERPSAVPREAG